MCLMAQKLHVWANDPKVLKCFFIISHDEERDAEWGEGFCVPSIHVSIINYENLNVITRRLYTYMRI